MVNAKDRVPGVKKILQKQGIFSYSRFLSHRLRQKPISATCGPESASVLFSFYSSQGMSQAQSNQQSYHVFMVVQIPHFFFSTIPVSSSLCFFYSPVDSHRKMRPIFPSTSSNPVIYPVGPFRLTFHIHPLFCFLSLIVQFNHPAYDYHGSLVSL